MSSLRRFLIVGMQRSGTSVTHAAAAGHPEISTLTEEIHASLFDCTVSERNTRGETRDSRTSSFLELFDHVAGDDEKRVFGLKTALPSPQNAQRLAATLATHGPDLDLVVVQRRDLVAQFGSLQLASATGTWHRRDNREFDDPVSVRIDPDALTDYVNSCTVCHRLLDRLRPGRRVLDLEYERDIRTGQAWSKLFRFLGVADLDPEWLRMSKRSPQPQDYIEDYADLVARLPAMVETARQQPLPRSAAVASDSRWFLQQRAKMQLQKGRPELAIDDARAALDAAPAWGVETRAGACDLIRAALEQLWDREKAASTAAFLAASFPGDPNVADLVAEIRTYLDPQG